MNFKEYLISAGYSNNTIKSYIFTITYYDREYGKISNENLIKYRQFLIDNCKPRTVNIRIAAINCYLKYVDSSCNRIQTVKYQQQTFLENVISFPDYEYLKSCLLRDDNLTWYYVVRFLGSTGARISELLQIKAEHIQVGFVDLYTKGGKIRRIYIPSNLQADAKKWLTNINKTTGFIFTNNKGQRLTARGVSTQMRKIAKKYDVLPSVVHPHSFRHMFAKTFIERYNDIALLADLMGHESIETTRIYLRKTANEQQTIVNKTVDW